jgi:flavodoxin
MEPCVLYLSRTGNTRRLAEAISDLLKAPIFDLTKSEPSITENFDLLILGTPVMGLKPAPEVLSFVRHLPHANGKRAILFCTYAISKGGTLKVLAEELSKKGYSTILSTSKRGFRPKKADFSDVLEEIAGAIK